ncbi:RICIN domain-containing protein [Nonomuraea candida]|uniref:RICIN domain-containing protein n=1 Tax=Nonomuraea candida TaxID=359159 RepID=UPI001470543B|nr:ricin-type beta-trefoil lectin domain protein [Nonomuraea candida]
MARRPRSRHRSRACAWIRPTAGPTTRTSVCCLDHPNQRWVIRDGHIVVEDTVGSGREVCLDATNSRANNTNVRLWSCLDHPNQRWVVQEGHIVVEDSLRP